MLGINYIWVVVIFMMKFMQIEDKSVPLNPSSSYLFSSRFIMNCAKSDILTDGSKVEGTAQSLVCRSIRARSFHDERKAAISYDAGKSLKLYHSSHEGLKVFVLPLQQLCGAESDFALHRCLSSRTRNVWT